MTQTITCPADGCDYTGLRQSVLAHYSGKRDNAHRGGYHDAKRLVDGDTADTPDPEPEAEPADKPKEPANSNNPTMGNANPDDPGEKVELPCGHESFDPSAAGFKEAVQEGDSDSVMVSCTTCSKAWTYEP